MKTEGTSLLLLTMSAFWSSSRWPLATYMSSRRQISIPLGGRDRQFSLYMEAILVASSIWPGISQNELPVNSATFVKSWIKEANQSPQGGNQLNVRD